MQYQVIQPSVELKDLVRNFYVLESMPGEVIPKEYQSMADGCPEIIFQYNGGFREHGNIKAYLKSQHSVFRRLNLQNNIGLLGIRFYPHAIQHLFGIPPSELINRVIDLNDILTKQGSFIERIIECDINAKRIENVSQFLNERNNSRSIDPIYKLVRLVMQGDGQINLSEMRQQIGLSERQFERRFKATAGFAPKHYARMMRFQSTRRRYVSENYKTLAELAQASNYADQSHFIREFKEFAGISPSMYFKLLSQDDNKESKIIRGLIIAKELPCA